MPLGVTDWSQVPESVHPGTSGTATIRSRQIGDIQLRLVVYSPNYVANDWCHKGHIVYVIGGQLNIEHRDTVTYTLESGMSYHAADDDGPPHRVRSESGATIFIVD